MSEAQPINMMSPGPALGVPAKLRWRLDPATTVVALASALIFIIVAIFVFLCFQGYGVTIDQARAKAQTATDLVANDMDFVFDGSVAALKFVAAAVPDPKSMTGEQKAVLDSAVAALPAGSSLAIYAADGTAPPLGQGAGQSLSIADSPALPRLASGTDFLVLPQGKDSSTGQATMNIAHRLGGPIFTGVAVVSMPASILETVWATQGLGKDSTLNVHLEDGEMVGRYPPLETPVNGSNSPNWPTIVAADSGTYVTTSPIDGVLRVVGFKHLRDLGLVVFATVSLDATLAGLWSSILIVSWLIAPIAVALLVGSLITASLLRRSARTQASLTTALASNDVLFREIHHRVKNNLQSVASLLQMQPIPREVKIDMSQRIAAMSAVHEHIYRSNDFAHVRVKQYLQTLIENIRGGQPDVQVIEDLADLSVDKDAATPLGLILNEVVSNAFKHAFKDGRKGVVTVSLKALNTGEGCLTVEDNGVGFDPQAPAKGIGRRLIGALTQQIEGQAAFTSSSTGGSRFTLSFPLVRAS
jgi:two-component system, sensor histidine kinase PdtaS